MEDTKSINGNYGTYAPFHCQSVKRILIVKKKTLQSKVSAHRPTRPRDEKSKTRNFLYNILANSAGVSVLRHHQPTTTASRDQAVSIEKSNVVSLLLVNSNMHQQPTAAVGALRRPADATPAITNRNRRSSASTGGRSTFRLSKYPTPDQNELHIAVDKVKNCSRSTTEHN